MPEYEVTSEIYAENDYRSTKVPVISQNVVSQFPFTLPVQNNEIVYDEDGDLIVNKPITNQIYIEHSPSTKLSLVGQQVWRGAFLLCDLLIHLGLQKKLDDSVILELGAGTGISSIIASMFAKKIICTDMEFGNILNLIKINVENNKHIINCNIHVLPMDFKDKDWSENFKNEEENIDTIIAADVIYDDEITSAFVSTIQKLLNKEPQKTLYMALEKRFVFTTEALSSVAPCYETFLALLDKVNCNNFEYKWSVELLPTTFPQYFKYDRVKELVLWRITSIKV